MSLEVKPLPAVNPFFPEFSFATMAENPAAPAAAAVGNVAVRLPEFWVEDPEFWFLQADAVFDTSRIVRSLTKYNYCLAKMPANVAATVKELARRVAAGDVPGPYEELRAKLLGSFQKSPWQLGFELLDLGDLGDRRPSVLMDAMLALLPPGCTPDYIFLCLFLRRLPADMRDQLAAQDIVDPAAMALAANRIFDARQQPGYGPVSAVGHGPRGRSASPRERPRRPAQGRTGNRQQTPGPAGSLCYYHERFGNKAHRCEKPCSWSGNPPAAARN
jgi:hypothetical protein